MSIKSLRQKQSKLSSKQIERKARSILRKLQYQGNILAPLADTEVMGANIIYGIINTGQVVKRPMVKVTADYVEAFHAKQWLEKLETGKYCLSSIGQSWLRREGAEHNKFQEQHHILSEKLKTDDTGIKRSVIINETETPLGWLRKRKNKAGKALIEDYQYKAGERLRADFTFAQLMPRVTTDWSFSGGGEQKRRRGSANATIELRENVLAAKKRVAKALEAVGPELSSIIIDICCHLKGLEEAEKLQGWPQRSGKVVLQLALTRLASHYGLISDEPLQTQSSQHILHWGKEDYRTNIE